MRKMLETMLYKWKIIKQKKDISIQQNGIKIVKHRETALILYCFGFIPSRKKGRTDITDDKGNILEKGIKDAEIDIYTKKYEDVAQAKYPDLPKEKALSKYLDELANRIDPLKKGKRLREFREDLLNYTVKRKELRAKYKGNQDKLWKDFKKAFQVEHFNKADNLKFFNEITEKYKKLARKDSSGKVIGPDGNVAQFNTKYLQDNKVLEEIVELVHSGKGNKYPDDFIKVNDRNEWTDFKKNIIDLDGQSRREDSELKYIFHFLRHHIDKADEFIIETKNIFITCTSCQQELLILKKYLESKGKRIKLVVYGDKDISGGKQFIDEVLK